MPIQIKIRELFYLFFFFFCASEKVIWKIRNVLYQRAPYWKRELNVRNNIIRPVHVLVKKCTGVFCIITILLWIRSSDSTLRSVKLSASCFIASCFTASCFTASCFTASSVHWCPDTYLIFRSLSISIPKSLNWDVSLCLRLLLLLLL